MSAITSLRSGSLITEDRFLNGEANSEAFLKVFTVVPDDTYSAQDVGVWNTGVSDTSRVLRVTDVNSPSLKNAIPDLDLIESEQVPGWSIIKKFGRNPSATINVWSTIWDEGGLYPYKFTANIIAPTIVSSDVGDVGKSVFIQGVDVDFNLVSEVILLNGTTPVVLVESYMIIFRMVNQGDGTDEAGSLAGDVTVQGTGADAGNVYAKIQDSGNDYNQTQMAIYAIPLGYVGIIKRAGRSVPSAKDAQIAYRAKLPGQPFQIKRINDLAGQSEQDDVDYFFDEKTVLDVIVKPSSTTSVSAWFDLILVEKVVFNRTFFFEDLT